MEWGLLIRKDHPNLYESRRCNVLDFALLFAKKPAESR